MDSHRDGHSQEDKGDGKQVKLKTSLLERMEESRADLKSDREHEQDQSEVLHETKHRGVHTETEMAQKNSHEQNPRGSDGDALELEFAKIQSYRDHNRENQNRMGYSRP